MKQGEIRPQFSKDEQVVSQNVKMSLEKGQHFRKIRNSDSGVKFQFDLDYERTSDSQDEQGQQSVESQSLTDGSLIPNVVPTFSYESRKDIGKSITRLRQLKSYQRCLILPDDPWKVKWNIFLIVVILFSSVTTPLRAAFYDEDDALWVALETFIDLVFVLDMVFTFFSAYYSRIEVLISSRREIVCTYLKTWFIVDLISVLPLSLFFRSNANDLGRLAKLPRIYQIIKTTKFARLLKAVKTRSRMRKRVGRVTSTNIEVDHLLSLLFIFTVLCHTFACLWFLVAKLQDFDQTTWVARYSYTDSPIPEQYLAGLYFIVTTISTVGYGDISSGNPWEQLFSLPLLIVGVVAYSVAISSITGVMEASTRKQKRLMTKLNVLSDLREEYGLPFEFYWRLRQSLHYDHVMNKTEHSNFVKELPLKLSLQLSNIMYNHQLNGIDYFERKSAEFVASIAPKLKPVKICKGDYIFLKGDTLDGIYFIKKGEAAFVERRPRADLIFATHMPGTHFGDIDFVGLNEGDNPRRNFTVKAKTDMDLLLMEKADLYSVDNIFKK